MTRPEAPEIPFAADERTTLLAFLDFYRSALKDRAWGLDHDQLQRTLAPSTLTIARIIGHMAWVEDLWFRVRFDGEEPLALWQDVDRDADGDGEMTLAQSWSVDELIGHFDAAVEDSNRRTAAASSLDQLSSAPTWTGEHWNLRWVLVHMIEEYARHCGHADLIRESIDGDQAR